MSAILGIFGAGAPRDDATVRALLARAAGRGHDVVAVWREPGAALAVSRFHWEADAGFGDTLVAEDGDLVVVADATLYYRADLRRRLAAAGTEQLRDSPAELILAALRTWGKHGVARLEGDFAFIAWDRRTRSVLCARDFGGRRPLCFAEAGSTLVIGSTLDSVRAHDDVPEELNLTAVAATAAALLGVPQDTPYRSVSNLPAGWLLQRRNEVLLCEQWWSPPAADRRAAPPFDEAADELRELLVRAVSERLDGSAPTSVTLSGGWDSSAVFAAGEEHFRRRGSGEMLRPVSISYPPGDSGREDELIESVLKHWNRSTRWIDIADIPFLVRPAAAAAARDEPFAHMFEHWLRALARGARAEGCRVALDGVGGDQLFSASLLYLADLLREGRWRQLRKEMRGKGLDRLDARGLFDLLLQPLLPPWARRVGAALRPTRSWAAAFEVHVPDWIDPEFSRSHGLLDTVRPAMAAVRPRRLADAEFLEYLQNPAGPRLVCAYSAIGMEEGIDFRSPLYDARIIEFAARRPVAERTSGNETKRLLRRACARWLPAAFLAPRSTRTGLTGTYARRALRQTHAAYIGEVLAEPVLAELGIVRAATLRERWTEFINGNARYETQLYLTFQTELWMRARLWPDRAHRDVLVTPEAARALA
jgi:asparagine synthase (glutamine-hydrolysing)